MRAILQSGFGPAADVLAIAEIDRPSVGPSEVLVRVRASGIAKGIWLLTHGLPWIARPAYGIRRPKQPVAGLQFAGEVAAIGEGVVGVSPGDAVFGSHPGALAEYLAVPREMVAPKPATVSFEQAAAAPISGTAALQAVRDAGRVRQGSRVLVIGASGGVGSYAVQIASGFGADVTAVASGRHDELVRRLGASRLVDYTREDPVDGRSRYDVIVDIAGNRPVASLRRALAADGVLVIVGGTGGRWTMGFGRTIGGMLLNRFVRHRIVGLISTANPRDLETLASLMETGRLTPVVREVYPFERTAEAIEAANGGHGAGTNVVRID